MSSFPIALLGDLVKIKGGKRLPKGSSLQEEENSHPYVRVRDMGARYIPDVGLEYVPDDVFPKIQRYIVEENDVIISIVGTIGLVSVIDERFHLGSQTENCAKLSGLDKVDALYLYYYLSSSTGQQEIKEATVGAVQAKLPLYNIEKIPVSWPDKNIREVVVSNLGGIDDKIELNRQTNQTLEHIAQAIFKSWFVDFEPTRAKAQVRASVAEGRMPGSDQNLPPGFSKEDEERLVERAAMAAISGKSLAELDAHGCTNAASAGSAGAASTDYLQQLRTTAALFPDALVESELGEIPEGWGVQTLEEILELVYGKALKKTDRVEGEFPVYGSGGLTGTHNQALVEGPGIIVGRKGTVGALYWEDSGFFPIDTVFYVRPKAGYSLEFIYYLLQTLGLEEMNTDAAVPGLNRNNAYRLEVIKASGELVTYFSESIEFIRKKLLVQKQETETLENIRDSLLPKLLSGELPIITDKAAAC